MACPRNCGRTGDALISLRQPRFTLLTATYNRAHLLPRLYEALCAQTFRDFEWIIVDDGSQDHTRDLISTWKADFPISYRWKTNGGKHTAVNIGVEQARGEFVLISDSDDQPSPNALERFDYHWRQIPDPDRFAFVVALCRLPDGSLLGSPLPKDYVDVFNVGQMLAVTDADRWGFCRADVFRRFLYPAFEGEKRMYEGVVWNRILRHYGARIVNEPLTTVYYQPDGITGQGDVRRKNPRGTTLYYREMALQPGIPLRLRLKAALNTLRFAPQAIASAVSQSLHGHTGHSDEQAR